MKPIIVRIQYDRCQIKLLLPNFFANAGVQEIRKALKLIRDRPQQNENVYEKLDAFFPEWAPSLREDLARAFAKRGEAERSLREAQSYVAGFGAGATKAMKNKIKAKRVDLERAGKAIARAQINLERYSNVLSLYKTAKAQRADKAQRAYKEQRRKDIKAAEAIKA